MNKRFKAAYKELGLNQIAVAEKTDLTVQQVRHISSGNTKITVELAELFEKKLGISSQWLLYNKGSMFDKAAGALDNAFSDFDTNNNTSRYSITYYPEIKAAAGNGYVNCDDSEVDIISLPKQVLAQNFNPGKIDAIKVYGDSMHPTISENDIIFISKKHTEIFDNKIYVLRYGDEIRVKRIFKRKDEKIVLRSDNNSYPDETVSIYDEDIKILGQVIYNMAYLA